MVDPIDVLCWASAGGAVLGAGAYVYGYVVKPRGDRRWHTASLLFSGFALANLPLILRHGADGPNLLNGGVLVAFLLLGMGCQIPIAFRQRKSDRRGERASDRAADGAWDGVTDRRGSAGWDGTDRRGARAAKDPAPAQPRAA